MRGEVHVGFLGTFALPTAMSEELASQRLSNRLTDDTDLPSPVYTAIFNLLSK